MFSAKQPRKLSKSTRIFYLLSFLEGGAVMATELIGAKLLAPFFGSSLYVWSTVMAVTLGGLAAGYFIGGRISTQCNLKVRLQYVLLAAGLFMIAMPFLSQFMLAIGARFSLIKAVLLCGTIMLLPPLFLMGMVSPMIIKCLTADANDSGKRAGEVYAISTLGGILSTFLTGFYLIPQFGLTWPVIVFGMVLMIVPLILLIGYKKAMNAAIVVVLGAAAVYLGTGNQKKHTGLLYESDGLLGKLEVLDYNYSTDAGQPKQHSRLLLINNIIQTWISLDENKSELEYTDVLVKNLKKDGTRRKALLLGLGGGAVANMLERNNYEVSAIELDERIYKVAKEYFNLSDKVKVTVDDARHGMDQLSEKYDLIMLDLFNGEVTPSHVLSMESVEKIRSLMADSARIVINTYGYLEPGSGNGNLALINTLKKSGLNYKLCNVGSNSQEDYRNLLIYASAKELEPLQDEISKQPDLSAAKLITDDQPVLEYLNANAAKRWRFNYLRNFILARN